MKRGYSIFIAALFLLGVSTSIYLEPVYSAPVVKEVYYQKKTTLTYPATYTLRFSLWDTETGGTAFLWSEEKPINMTSATIKTYLGEFSPLDGVDFSQQYWVQVERKKKNGTYVPIGVRDMFVVVPYALFSETSSGVPGSISGITAGAGLTGGGTSGNVTLNVNFGGTGAASTVSRSDHDHDATYVNQTGDTMSGTLNINTGSGYGLNATTTGSGHAVYGYTTGTGNAGRFQISNASSSSPALYGYTNGTGTAVAATTSGTGRAGEFSINNASNSSAALYVSTSGSGAAVEGYNVSTGMAGYFHILNASSSSPALYSYTNGSGPAVEGYTGGTGRAGHFQINNASSSSDALYGTTNGSGNAVYGYTTGTSSAGWFEINNPSSINIAIYGTTNGSGNAVEGYTTGTGPAGYFLINNASNSSNAIYGRTTGTGYAGYFNGNVYVTGTLTKGSGTFVQPHPTEPTKELVYAFFEGPEHAIFLRGTTKLVGGKAVIETPEYFRVVAGDEGITVQFTPRYVDTFGLAAVEVTKEEIVVQELKGGTNTYEFDYFITAKRAGFEKHEPIQPNKHFKADNMTREEFEQRYAKTDDMTIAAMRNLLISNGILTKDGKLNMEMVSRLGWTLKETDIAMTLK